MEIRDTRNGDWFWVNTSVNACQHLTAHDKVVYGALSSFGGCAEIRPSLEEIARRSAVSVRKAKMSVRALASVGIISIQDGGGRGRTNVYVLLKAAKGCTTCTVSKPCKPKQETVQTMTVKGAPRALELDKELNKELDKDNTVVSTLASPELASGLVNELIEAFRPVNPTINRVFSNRTQRAAIERLVKQLGEKELRRIIGVLPDLVKEQYAPVITTPLQLETKLGQLATFISKKATKRGNVALIS